MTTIARIVTGVAVAASLSAPGLAQDVTYDYHRGTDFSQLQTFAFKDTPPADEDASKSTAYDSPIVRQNTNAAVAAQLQGRGMTRNDDHPDVYVTTRRTFQTQYIVYGSPGWGYGWGYYGYGPYYTEPITVGTLTVDIIRAATGELLWRGVAERDMHPMSNQHHRLERINREVTKMFKKYPAIAVATSGRETPTTTDR